MADSMAVVDKMYECFGRGDMDTLKSDVFATDIVWRLPGHHPLSGAKQGADEVIAFFGALIATGVNVDNVSFGTIGDTMVVETPSGEPAQLQVTGVVYDPSLAPSPQEQRGYGYLSSASLGGLVRHAVHYARFRTSRPVGWRRRRSKRRTAPR